MGVIDLRSDTVTKPTEEMRAAMAAAEVGDDVYEDDPTVKMLEEESAALTGQEAGLFVTSGTQGNLVALLCHCQRGDGAIIGRNCHIYNYEAGGLAVLGGILPLLADDAGGIVKKEEIESWIIPPDVHKAPAKLLCLENTHNREGGTAVAPDIFKEVTDAAKVKGLKVHLDGARIFNAATAWDVDVRKYTAEVDSVQFCLSKGLGSPVGSMLCGPKEFIREARHWRKRLGGGLRQVGVLAAAGLISIRKMKDRLIEDHKNAQKLANMLADGGLFVEEPGRRTNMVYFSVGPDGPDANAVVEACKKEGILFNSVSDRRIRLVTHLGITESDVETAARSILREAFAS